MTVVTLPEAWWDAIPTALHIRRLEDRAYVAWNRAAEDLFRKPRQQVLGRTDEEIFPSPQAAAFRIRDDSFLAGAPRLHEIEEPATIGVGQTVWINTALSRFKTAEGEFLLGIVRDLTERRRAEQAARVAQGEAENLLSVMATILIQVDEDDCIRRFNGAAERIFGVTAVSVLGRPLAECGLRMDWGEIIPRIIMTMGDHQPREMRDIRAQRIDGAEFFLDLHLVTTQGDSGVDHPSVLVLGHDVTQRREDELTRVHGQKLESIGQLAAGIAHEINTPIQFIGDNLRFITDSFKDLQRHSGLLRDRLAQGAQGIPDEVTDLEAEIDLPFLTEEIPKAVEQSLEGVERVADIVRAMKAFSHPDGDGNIRQVDLNAAIRTTCTVARNEYKYHADLVLELDPGLPTVMGHAGELNQVFLNLLVNAAHAIAERHGPQSTRGTIRIVTACVGTAVELRLTDDGGGIRPEHHAKIFTHFFTTKAIGKGTGQGLALCHTIVTKKHHGTIRFESEVGRGTTFIITLPLRWDAPAPGAAGPGEACPPSL